MKILEADVMKVIKDLSTAYGASNEDQGKMVSLLKGLAFSDDPKANTFMKKLDKATTDISNEMSKDKKESFIVTKEVKISEDFILEVGDRIQIIENWARPTNDREALIYATMDASREWNSGDFIEDYQDGVLSFLDPAQIMELWKAVHDMDYHAWKNMTEEDWTSWLEPFFRKWHIN